MKANVFEHKGYAGSIEFSVEDNVLCGKVLFIEDLVNYEAETIEGLRSAFIEAVDFYLQACEEEGVSPDKPCSGSFNIRVPQQLHRKAQLEAARLGVTLNEFVRMALENETIQSRRVTIHNHNHEHRHTHSSTAQLEVTATYRETTKWTHESQQATKH